MEWRNNTQNFSYFLSVIQISSFSYNTNIFFIVKTYFLKKLIVIHYRAIGITVFYLPF